MNRSRDPVLVTGGAGFIGSWTVEKLVGEGYTVIVLDNLSSGSKDNLYGVMDKIEFVHGDIKDTDLLDKLFSKYRFKSVIHLAALVGVNEVADNPVEGYSVNVTGTFNLLEMCRRHGIERLVYASSAAVYGDPLYLPVNEGHTLNPKNLYGATKLAGEALVNSYSMNYGLSTISLRYFNVYGPRMKGGPYAGVIYAFINSILEGKPLTIYGDGLQTRDFVYVEDVAEANLIALESNATGSYNIGSGSSISIKDLAYLIKSLSRYKDIDIVYREPRPGDIRHSRADITKACRVLGWRPKTSLREGLLKTINYYLSSQGSLAKFSS